MLIKEIVTVRRHTQQRAVPWNMMQRGGLAQHRRRRLPSGEFGSVISVQEPGVVDRSEHVPRTPDRGPDGFETWISAVSRLQDQAESNPYLPTVYEIKVTKDPLDRSRRQYRLQNLHSWQSLPGRVLIGLVDREIDLGQTQTEYLLGLVDREIDRDQADIQDLSFLDSSRTKKLIWLDLVRELRRALVNRDYHTIKNRNLVQALKLAREAIDNDRTRELRPDLGIDNVMIRLTSTGPHLVITDPIAD